MLTFDTGGKDVWTPRRRSLTNSQLDGHKERKLQDKFCIAKQCYKNVSLINRFIVVLDHKACSLFPFYISDYK